MRQRLTAALLLIFLSVPIIAKAGEHPSRRSWYVGVDAGIPFSAGSFSSFAQGGPYAGWVTGLLAGYNFNDFVGIEADLGIGRSNLAARKGCIENNYYLGADDILYYAAPLGMDSWSVAEFKTGTNYQRFGISARVNLLGFVRSRWTLALSPRISLCHTSTKFYSLSGSTLLRPAGKGSLHFGYGGAVQLGYQISPRFHIGLSSGITSLTGNALDGIPSHGHKANLIWENSLRLCISLSSGKRTSAVRAPQYSTTHAPAIKLPSPSEKIEKPAVPQSESLSELPVRNPLPECRSVYFEFDKWRLRAEESGKLHDILEAMLSDGNLTLTLEGWCDRYGSDEACEAISALRAESVKKWFVKQGVSPDRITAVGKGRDTRERVNALARRVKAEVHSESSVQKQQ